MIQNSKANSHTIIHFRKQKNYNRIYIVQLLIRFMLHFAVYDDQFTNYTTLIGLTAILTKGKKN